MKGVKATTWNWDEIQTEYTADDNLYILSEREIGVLLTAIIPAAWRTRWFDRPADFELIEDFVGQLNDRLMSPVDLCALVAECIRNPDSPANAAVREIGGSNNGYPPNQTPPSDQRNKDILLGTNPTCDLDKLYGQCDYVMTETNQFIVDFLERFEVTFNFSEVLAALAAAPAINESGAETLAQYAQYIQEVLPENYAAQFTTELKQQMTCGLFCIAKDTCSLTIAQIADYFAGLLGATLTPGDLLIDIVAALFGIPMSGNYVVYSLFTLVWKGLELANIALDNVGDSVLTVALQAGAGEPSDDWMLFCDDCSVPAGLYYDFTAGAQGFTITNPPNRGVYSGGFETTNNASGGTSVLFERVMTSAATVVKVRLEYDMTVSPQANPLSRVIRAGSPQATIKNTSFPLGVSQATKDSISVAVTSGQKFGFDLNLDDAAPYTSGVGKVLRAWVYFSGAIPDTADWGGVEFYE